MNRVAMVINGPPPLSRDRVLTVVGGFGWAGIPGGSRQFEEDLKTR